MVARRGERAPRTAHGQHFLKSRALARRLVAGAAVTERDLVLDLGAGRGIIAEELARKAGHVIAVELDPRLACALKGRFCDFHNVEVAFGNILDLQLPEEPFKVVASLPFSATTAMLRRLLSRDSRLTRAQLILQKGAAVKRTRARGNMMNASVGPWFQLTMGRTIPRNAFRPPPSVDGAVLDICRRSPSLLDHRDRSPYERMVQVAFKSSQLPLTKSLRSLYEGRRIKTAVRSLRAGKGATALDLNMNEWAELFKILST